MDSLALLDLVWSFADFAISSDAPYTQPCIHSGGLLAITAGRHPILEVFLSKESPYLNLRGWMGFIFVQTIRFFHLSRRVTF